MINQNADLYLIRLLLNQLSLVVDALEKERRHNDIQDNHLSEHEHRITALESQLKPKYEALVCKEILQILDKQNEQIEECKDLILNRIRYQDSEIEELQGLVSIYCLSE